MPVHLRRDPRFYMLLFALWFIEYQQQPWQQSRQITAEQWEERGSLLGPIIQRVVLTKRDHFDVYHSPELEGKAAKDYQLLLDLADYVRHDPANNQSTHFYATLFDFRTPESSDNVWHYCFIIVVRGNCIESAELPPLID